MVEVALVHALPVLREELPVLVGFHCCVILLATDETFHQARFLIDKFCCVLFFGHRSVCRRGSDINRDPELRYRGYWWGSQRIPYVSFMVRLAPDDPERTVYLFQQQEPGHRVGKGHLGEREPQVAPCKNCRRKPDVPPYYKSHLVLHK